MVLILERNWPHLLPDRSVAGVDGYKSALVHQRRRNTLVESVAAQSMNFTPVRLLLKLVFTTLASQLFTVIRVPSARPRKLLTEPMLNSTSLNPSSRKTSSRLPSA